MSLLDLLGLRRFPPAAKGATLLIADAAEVHHARDFIDALAQHLGPLALALTGGAARPEPAHLPTLTLPHKPQRLHGALGAPRVIALGACGGRADVFDGASGTCYWLNARAPNAAHARCRVVTVADARAARQLPDAQLTGDPLIAPFALPAATEGTLCERFRDQRAAGRWVGYFAATGEDEEAQAYGAFFQLARRRMGLLVLAPADPARYEPVYREAIKYRLPTNRHNRLSTSFVPVKTRVYYVEDAEVLRGLYACADFVVAGGTLAEAARCTPDVVTPLAAARATLVGPARHDALIEAALRAGALAPAADTEALVETAAGWIADPEAAAAQGAAGREWLALQSGARERVLKLLA